MNALKELELLVTVDPFMTNTARLSHYVIPPKMMFERADIPSRDFEPFVTLQPYAQYSAPVVAPPVGAEVIDDWYLFWALAKRLDKTVTYDGVALDMQNPPTTEQLLAILMRNSVVAFEELRRHPGGKLFDAEPMVVQAPPGDDRGQFDVMPEDVRQELDDVAGEPDRFAGFSHRLAVRRLRDVHNTSLHNVPAIRRAVPYNAAYLHPGEFSALGIAPGQHIWISSPHGRMEAIAETDAALRPGVVSIAHGWGSLPDEAADIASIGTNVNLLTSAALPDLEPINGMSILTGVPVNIAATR